MTSCQIMFTTVRQCTVVIRTSTRLRFGQYIERKTVLSMEKLSSRKYLKKNGHGSDTDNFYFKTSRYVRYLNGTKHLTDNKIEEKIPQPDTSCTE